MRPIDTKPTIMFSITQIVLDFAARPGKEDQNPPAKNAYDDIDNVSHVIVLFASLSEDRDWLPMPPAEIAQFKVEIPLTTVKSLPN
jgi:hypothetical protein